jgi:hypothetical protein
MKNCPTCSNPMKPMKKVTTKKRPLNAYMKKVMSARKSGADSFEYNGKKYVKAKTKTGMIIYKLK